MSWRALASCLLIGCAPLVAGTARLLPPELQRDPAALVDGAETAPSPGVERLVLQNGLEVFWVPNPGAPIATLAVLANCGRTDEPIGAAGVTWSMWAGAFSAGTSRSSSREQEVAWARLGLVPAISVNDGDSSASFGVLSGAFPEAARLIAEAVFQPRYEASALATMNEAVARRASRSESWSLLVRRVLASKQGALGQPLTAEGYRALTPAQVATQARGCLQPANLVLAASGDFDAASLRSALEPFSGGPAGLRRVHPSPPAGARGRSIWLSPEPGTRSVEVTIVARTGALGPRERATGEVLMATLAGTLSARLRERLGLVYAVQAALDTGPGFGLAAVTFSTRREKAFEAVRQTTMLFDDWWTRWPIPASEAERLRTSLSVAEARRSPGDLAIEAARRRLIDGPTFVTIPMAQLLREVTMEEILQLFIAAFPSPQRQIIVLGDFDPALAWGEFGEVTAP